MRYKISIKAAEDIENIWLYTKETWSITQADKYYNLIFDEIEKIAEHPTRGRNCNHIRENYRCLKVKSHFIFYKFLKNEEFVEIIRVLHQNMDIENRLNE